MNCNNHKYCNPVTLVDGSMSCTWSSEWMAECLAREVGEVLGAMSVSSGLSYMRKSMALHPLGN